MNDQTQLLRIGIDGRWEATEFARSLNALDQLYTLRFALEIEAEVLRDLRDFYADFPYPFHPSPKLYRRWVRHLPLGIFITPKLADPLDKGAIKRRDLLEPNEKLLLRRVIYGSPGIKDLAGVGEVIGHVKDLMMRIIEYWSTRRQRDLENDRRELENKKLQIEIAKEFVGIAQELGYTKKEMRQLVASVAQKQKPLVRLVSEGKIVSVDTIQDEGEQPSDR